MIELSMALAIAAIVFALAASAVGALADRARIARLQTELSAVFIDSARQAVAGGVAVVLCPAGTGRSGCADGFDWSDGWLAFADRDGDRHFSDGDAALVRVGPPGDGLRLLTSRGRPKIVFQPDGDSAGSNATFVFCSKHGRSGTLMLSNAGRFRVAQRHPTLSAECTNN
ncbi:type IV pilus assembly protein FimT [Lysobacter enzymogenes]|uniref:Type II secretion system protein H n=1 Tax=Lysobacter enzymogenes TaxID=69 RepID=A0AAU9AGF1_LYSEN|nr:type IV pilus assembly protein FimT [Lysobacter enzymogenes]